MIWVLIFACQSEKALDTGQHEDVQEDTYPYDIAEECHPDLAGWSDPWMGAEFAALNDINRMREMGADCNSMGVFEPAPPLEMDPYLHCSARYHSLWMVENDAMQHASPGGELGENPQERMTNSGFPGLGIGENVAAGSPSPTDTVASWMASDGHCANIMSPDANVAGVGYYNTDLGYMHYWTLNTGQLN